MEDIMVLASIIIGVVAPYLLQWFKNAGYDLKGKKVQWITFGVSVVIAIVSAALRGKFIWADVVTLFSVFGIVELIYGQLIKKYLP